MWNYGRTKTQKVGLLGEDIAVRFLTGRGYEVVERNWQRAWGEIDLVTRKDGALCFVEVKTVQIKVPGREKEQYRPEENLHPHKLARFARAAESYVLAKGGTAPWSLALVAVVLDVTQKTAHCSLYTDIATA